MKFSTAYAEWQRRARRSMIVTALFVTLGAVTLGNSGGALAADQPAPNNAPASSPQKAAPSASPQAGTYQPLPRALTTTLLIGITIVWVIALLALIKALRLQGWNVKDALMEEAVLPPNTPPPAAGAIPPMVASSSRLIALVGMIVLGAFFVAIGYIVIWDLCEGQSTQEAQRAWSYFAAGATLFLPYGVNKVSNILK